MKTIKEITVDGPWLVGDELHLCIVQTAPPSIDDIKADSPRLANVSLLQHLLQGRPDVGGGIPILTELLPGSGPCIVMFPEYSFGSDDWFVLNSAIGSAERPLVLFAGFGASTGELVKHWASTDADDYSQPHCFETPSSLAPTSLYNGAWCWVHRPGIDTRCYCFLKTFPDQRIECITIPDLALGEVPLVFSFDDLVITPGICADLLCGQTDNWRDTITKHLENTSVGKSKSVFFAGLLYQKPPGHELWQNAIDGMLNIPLDRPGFSPVVALANHALGTPEWDKTSDCWRSQSGVFTSKNVFMSQEYLSHVKKVTDRNFIGVLIRRSEPCAVGGRVRWSKSATTGMFLWHVGKCAIILSCNEKFSVLSRNIEADYECERLLKRLILPKLTSGTEVLVDERDSLLQFIVDHKMGARLISSLLQGLDDTGQYKAQNSKVICTWIKDDQRKEQLRRGLVGLLFLKKIEIGNWSNEKNTLGQIHKDLGGKHVHTLVWSSVELTGLQMNRSIEQWVNEFSTTQVLLVIGQANSGALNSGRVKPEKRCDVTVPDDRALSRSASIVDISNVRQAYVLSLEEVENFYSWQDDYKRDLMNHVLATLES
ncbi:MAG: hypothetical protein M0P27_00195 [Bacteroidales bacterium]|nr:hypothetical protein [Bacteroidales bacterium]